MLWKYLKVLIAPTEPTATPLVSCDPILLEAIETDKHLKDLDRRSMHGKKYVSGNKANPGKDTTHTWENDEKDCTNFTRRLGDWPQLPKRKFQLSGR